MHIAIDGPSGAGKSTIAKLLARKLNYLYLDTGAMYRTCGLLALREGVDMEDGQALEKMIKGAQIKVARVGGAQRMMLNGEDVEDYIRTPQISMAGSKVSAVASVRRALVKMQQDIAQGKSVVMDGRDIGTKVLPNAQYKFFLTASPEVRAQRRYNELMNKGELVTLEQVHSDIVRRDHQDTTRKESPLAIASDATEVVTDDLAIDEVVQVIMALMGKY